MVWTCGRTTANALLRAVRAPLPRFNSPPCTFHFDPRAISRSIQASAQHREASFTTISARTSTRTRSASLPNPTSVAPATEAESSVARGTRYENLCRAVLHHIFGMELERTGGAGDRGIDLRGWWTPAPSLSAKGQESSAGRIRIVAQCKCQDEGGKKMGPVLVREMEGVVFRASFPAPAPSVATQGQMQAEEQVESAPVAGIILSSTGFSKQALLQVRSSNVPLAAMHVVAQPQPQGEAEDEVDPSELVERCVSIVWNDRFGSPTQGLLEGGMEVRWVRSLSGGVGSGDTLALGRPVIYRAGKPLK
ncbi:uncharacterized protein UTRI_00029 [Ustilago trichophora]|uniref:Restriction endonuclease type IV Mrr domain-containing protein n=1 Tax=Ustilago trichophora TaxID=86804 RepID=A0A5C3DQB2_9BASI|nr:uncharacterized protein UTRI_00029 [Ustilago trichophora]